MEGRRNKVAYLHDEASPVCSPLIRSVVNCTVNRGLLFGGGKRRRERENQSREIGTVRRMIYGAIVENNYLADQRTFKLLRLPLASKCYHALNNELITCAWDSAALSLFSFPCTTGRAIRISRVLGKWNSAVRSAVSQNSFIYPLVSFFPNFMMR